MVASTKSMRHVQTANFFSIHTCSRQRQRDRMNTSTAVHRLGSTLIRELHLTAEPLQHLPLAVIYHGTSGQCTYCFPSPDGIWVPNQCATDAAMFLTQYLSENHMSLVKSHLGPEQLHTLQIKTTAQLCLLRTMRASLPQKRHLQAAYAKVMGTRIPFLDGAYDLEHDKFTPLPFAHKDMVFHTLQVSHEEMLSQPDEKVQQARELIASSWFLNPQERSWVLRHTAKSLSPMDTDTLGDTPGDRGETTWLYLLEQILGPALCTVSAGDCLTTTHARAHLNTRSTALVMPLIEGFDELAQEMHGPREHTLSLAAVKTLTSGRPPCTLIWLSCNPENLPYLQKVAATDPAAFNRLVFLPAHQLAIKDSRIHARIDHLKPALTRILFEEHLLYRQHGSLPVPSSMLQHRDLLVRYSCLQSFKQCHFEFATDWSTQNCMPAKTTALEQLADRFLGTCTAQVLAMQKHYQSMWGPSQLAAALLDACLAKLGHDTTVGG